MISIDLPAASSHRGDRTSQFDEKARSSVHSRAGRPLAADGHCLVGRTANGCDSRDLRPGSWTGSISRPLSFVSRTMIDELCHLLIRTLLNPIDIGRVEIAWRSREDRVERLRPQVNFYLGANYFDVTAKGLWPALTTPIGRYATNEVTQGPALRPRAKSIGRRQTSGLACYIEPLGSSPLKQFQAIPVLAWIRSGPVATADSSAIGPTR